jgi:hypothetical protein
VRLRRSATPFCWGGASTVCSCRMPCCAENLLLALVVRGELLLGLERHLAIEDESSPRERLIMALSVLGGWNKAQWQQLLRLVHDDAEDAKLAQARLHGGVSGQVVGLLKEGHGELEQVVRHGEG